MQGTLQGRWVRVKELAIAFNTFRECIRDRILYNLLIFAILIIGLSGILSTLSIGEQVRIILNIGLAAIEIFGVMMAIFLGIGLVYKEIERRTIYTILSKPIKRYQFLIGKFSGLLFTLLVNLIIMTVGLVGIVYLMGWSVNIVFFQAIVLIFMEFVLVTSIALLFSCFSTPTLSAIFTLSFFVIGHLTEDIKFFGSKADNPIIQKVSLLIYYILPNLENFNIKASVVDSIVRGLYFENVNSGIDLKLLAYSILYGLSYTLLLFLLSVLIFDRRDFK